MTRIAIGAAVIALALAAVAPTGASTGKLIGTVGPGYTISLKFKGKKVTKLKAGKYTLVVSDKASIHSFVLERSGGAFEKTVTSVPFTGTKTITVTLKKGKYEFYCKPHESFMHGDFTVT